MIMDKLNMIDLFAGTGAFSYIGNKHNIKCTFANDNEESSKKIYELNHKNKLTCEDINDVNTKSIGKHDILCAGFPCFIKGTNVLTLNGYKNIEDVNINDKLLTHNGIFETIINIQEKIYDKELINIKIKYHPNNIICTEEHPFYVREHIKKWDNNLGKYAYSFNDPEWIPANKLNDNHFYGMVINKYSIIPEFTFEQTINRHKKIKNTITIDKLDMWFMIGYFVGNGWIEETKKNDGRLMHKIRFAVNNSDEEYILSRIINILNITDKKCNSGKCKKYGCANNMWYNILKTFGKYAHGKLIPEWVQNAPTEYIREFINGYMKANGCINKDNSYQITTVSIDLAFGLQRLYLKIGHIFSIIKTIRKDTCVIQGRIVNQRDTYKIVGRLNKIRNSSSFIENDYVWYKVDSMTRQQTKNINVYNFEVSNDNSYVVENIIVHNCQPFSIAGKQLGFDDERSNVFWKLLKIIKFYNPEIIILENVKNLQTHNKGDTFKTIYKSLTELGYNIKHSILNTSKITSIPQHRERIYIICFKDIEKYNKFNFDFPKIKQKKIKDILEYNIEEKYYYNNEYKVYDEIKKNVTKHINDNVLYQYRRYYVRENKSNLCPTLTANMGCGGHNVPLLLDDKGIRKLTPRECFNLQGFPEDFILPNISDSKLYKLAGNAVSIPVIDLIFKKIIEIDNVLCP